MISVALVDDHRLVTRSLRAWLESFPDIRVTGIASSGEEVLKNLDAWSPDIVLQDLLLPGGMDGIETTRRILAQSPRTKVIALTASIDEPRRVAVMRAGASAYLRKDTEPETLLCIVRQVAAGQPWPEPAHTAAPDDLTPREYEVLRHVARGRSNKEIAEALTVSDETVKSHVGNLLGKLHAENRSHAVAEAMRRGMISTEDL